MSTMEVVKHPDHDLEAVSVAQVPFLEPTPSGWSKAVAGLDGKIYGIPRDASSVLVLDPQCVEPSRFGHARVQHHDGPTALIWEFPQANAENAACVSNLGDFGNAPFKWGSANLDPVGGCIFALPCHARRLLVIDPARQVTRELPLPGVDPELPYKWMCSTLVNGKVYGMPWSAPSVLCVDCATEEVSMIGNLGPMEGKWAGGIAAQDGRIFGLPANERQVLVIDPRPARPEVYKLGHLPDRDHKWLTGVRADDGRIFGIPWKASWVLVIDPPTDTVQILDLHPDLKPSPLGNSWLTGILADGKIYALPRNAGAVLVIDPAKNSVSAIGNFAEGGEKWGTGVLSSEEPPRIFGLPCSARSVLVVDPRRDAAWTCGEIDPGPPGSHKWLAGALANDGCIYGVPCDAKTILVLEPSRFAWHPDRHADFPESFRTAAKVLCLCLQHRALRFGAELALSFCHRRWFETPAHALAV